MSQPHPNKYMRDYDGPPKVTQRRIEKLKGKRASIRFRGNFDPLTQTYYLDTTEIGNKIGTIDGLRVDLVRRWKLAGSNAIRNRTAQRIDDIDAKRAKLVQKRDKQQARYSQILKEIDEGIDLLESLFSQQKRAHGLGVNPGTGELYILPTPIDFGGGEEQ